MNRNVIISTNYNPLYVQFVPLVCSVWKKWGFKVHLVLITDDDESVWGWMRQFANIIHEKRHPNIYEGIWSKVARIIHYMDFGDEVVMVSDVDMIPLSFEYFDDLFYKSTTYPDKLVLSSYDAYLGKNQFNDTIHHKYPGCYMLATSNIWKEIINPKDLSIGDLLETWKGKHDFDDKEDILNNNVDFSEESLIRRIVAEWDFRKERIIKMKRGWINNMAINRIDRSNWYIDMKKLNKHKYIDCHSIRPLQSNEDKIKPLLEYLEIDTNLIELGVEMNKLK